VLAFIDIFTDICTPRSYGLQHEDIELLTSDKIILRCYLVRPSSQTKASKTSEPIELEAAVVCHNFQSQGCTLTDGLKVLSGVGDYVSRKCDGLRRFY
jgi:hypothetical protein